ncbi:RNA polymerase sigma factor [Sphingomonas sp. CJ20]
MVQKVGNREPLRWVATRILPHEPALRRWLARAGLQPSDVDDVIQQTYCKLSELGSVAHIRDPRAYFFTTARSFVLQHVRREKVVQIQAASDHLDMLADEGPTPERIASDRWDLRLVNHAIADLPPRYREAIELRRLEGLSQKETAARMGVSEKVVENSLARGLKAVLRSIAQGSDYYSPQEEEPLREEAHVVRY